MLLTLISVNSFKTNSDKFWCSQDVYYNDKCDIATAMVCWLVRREWWLTSYSV